MQAWGERLIFDTHTQVGCIYGLRLRWHDGFSFFCSRWRTWRHTGPRARLHRDEREWERGRGERKRVAGADGGAEGKSDDEWDWGAVVAKMSDMETSKFPERERDGKGADEVSDQWRKHEWVIRRERGRQDKTSRQDREMDNHQFPQKFDFSTPKSPHTKLLTQSAYATSAWH